MPYLPSALVTTTHRVLGFVLIFWMALLLPQYGSAADETGAPGLVVTRAVFQLDGGAARELALPHTWARDGLPNSGRAHYQVAIDLPRVPTTAWSLGADRMSSRFAVRINGSLVHGALPLHVTGQRAAPIPAIVDLPSALLRPGRNLIEIDVEFEARAGISPLRIGPTDWVRAAYARAETFGFTVPQALNVGATVLALFMLTIWIRRRSETEIGTFCALMVVVSVRNIVSTGVGNDWHGNVIDVVTFVSQVATVVLLALFAMAFARRDWPAFRWFVLGAGVALVAIGLGATWVGAGLSLRVWVYPIMLAMVLPSLWLIISGARTKRRLHQATLTLTTLLIFGAAVHDYLFLRGLTSVMDRYWMPFASPLALLIFAWAVLLRLVGALAAIETQAGELEVKVTERTRELEVANAAKTRFLAAASHDLRQPVVSIGLLTELLREQPLPAPVQPILARIGDSVQALNTLLRGLLDLSRFDAGAVEVRAARFALRPLMERVMGDEAEAARRKGIALRLRTEPFVVHSDALLLEQILRNLVANAVRYTQRGGVLVSARRRGNAQVLLQVWDTGTGIPAESQTQVFEEFVQLGNNARGRAGGLGLGLSLVRRAAGVMGVPVGLRSTVDRGSCFSVGLPLAGLEPALGDATPAAEFGLRGHQVWVVEDDPDVRAALRLRLVGWGAKVHEFGGVGSVRRSIHAAQLALPDLLVCDQRLLDGTGIEAAQLLRSRDATLPVLLLTGDTSPADIARLRASGLPVLYKPFTSDELLTAVRALNVANHATART